MNRRCFWGSLLLSIFATLAYAEPPSSATDTERGYLGLRLYYEPQPNGDGAFRINGVLPEGPAGRAGVLEGDLIVRVNGQTYRNDVWDAATDDAFDWVQPGDTLELEVLRGEAAESVDIRVVAARLPNIDSLRQSRGNAAILDLAHSALDRLAEGGTILEIDVSKQSIRRLGDPLDPAAQEALEHLFFEASGLGRGLLEGGETGPRRLRLSLDSESGNLRFDNAPETSESQK